MNNTNAPLAEQIRSTTLFEDTNEDAIQEAIRRGTRAYLSDHKISKTEFERRYDISRTTIAKLLNHPEKKISTDALQRLAKAIGYRLELRLIVDKQAD